MEERRKEATRRRSTSRARAGDKQGASKPSESIVEARGDTDRRRLFPLHAPRNGRRSWGLGRGGRAAPPLGDGRQNPRRRARGELQARGRRAQLRSRAGRARARWRRARACAAPNRQRRATPHLEVDSSIRFSTQSATRASWAGQRRAETPASSRAGRVGSGRRGAGDGAALRLLLRICPSAQAPCDPGMGACESCTPKSEALPKGQRESCAPRAKRDLCAVSWRHTRGRGAGAPEELRACKAGKRASTHTPPRCGGSSRRAFPVSDCRNVSHCTALLATAGRYLSCASRDNRSRRQRCRSCAWRAERKRSWPSRRGSI